MDKSVVYQKMRELEVKIHYHFNDIAWLSKAMRSEKIEVSGEGKNHSEYTNDGLAKMNPTEPVKRLKFGFIFLCSKYGFKSQANSKMDLNPRCYFLYDLQRSVDLMLNFFICS